jgi:MFS family permease
MEKQMWLVYVILAGLAWGTYVPLIFYGGSELGGKPNARLLAILCVGVAYFVMAVLFPLILFLSGTQEWPSEGRWGTGLTFAGVAGAMGALGAICVIFASKEAMAAGTAEFGETRAALSKQIESAADEATKSAHEAELKELDSAKPRLLARYRIFIAPLIFGLAPIINTLLSSLWHPKPGDPIHFTWDPPGMMMLLGIVLVGAGVFLVLFAKEESEAARGGPKPAAVKPQ